MSPGASETDSDSVADTVDEQKHEEMYYCACRIQAGDAGGSGICIYSDRRENGYAHTLVLTNHHVVDDLISVEEQWDPTLQEERKQEVTETATVEFFQYNDYSKAVGTQAYQADVVAWDHQDRRDIALLELRETEATMDHVAGMLPYDQRESIYMFDQVYAVGAALGHPVFQTPGEVTNAQIEMGQQTYIGTNSPISFGSCLAEGSMVMTANRGAVPIEAVTNDDTVYSIDPASDEQVVADVDETIESGKKDVYEVTTPNKTVVASDNHPLLVASQTGKTVRNGSSANEWVCEWVSIDDISAGDVIVTMGETEHGSSSLDPNEAYFVGLMEGDGWVGYKDRGNYMVELAHHHDERQQRIAEMERVGLSSRVTNGGKQLTALDKDWYERLSALGIGDGALEKSVPTEIWNADETTKAEFVRGLASADAHERGTDNGRKWKLELNNTKLVREIGLLCESIGWRTTNVSVRDRTDHIQTINGRVVQSNAPSATVEIYPDRDTHNTMLTDAYGVVESLDLPSSWNVERIREIEHGGVQQTYDIKVDGYHNFVADGVVVHNSGGGLFKQGADEHYYLIGLPARVSMQGFGSVANHIGFAVPVDEIYDFLDENHVQYIWQDDVTIAECEQKRANKRAPDQD